MDTSDSHEQYLKRLAGWRTRSTQVGDLKYLKDQFDRQVARPFKQLGDLTKLWPKLIPRSLAEQTQLLRLQRGVLHVAVPDSAVHFQLDRHLRSGALLQLRRQFKGNLRQVRIEVRGQ